MISVFLFVIFREIILNNALDLPLCEDFQQYSAIQNCSGGYRLKTFHTKPGMSCKPKEPERVNCECKKEDFVATYSECKEGKRLKTLHRITDCLGSIDPPEEVPCECTKNDVAVSYGPCNGTRDVYFNYKKSCDSTNLPLLDPLLNVKCDFSCKENEFYDITLKKCKVCDPGTYAKDFSLNYADWSSIPKEFILEHDEEATDWKPAGSAVITGTQPSNSSTYLSLDVDIVAEKGYVEFSFECYKLQFDENGLIFFIDDNVAGSDAVELLTSNEWKELRYNLPFGHHRLTWMYKSGMFASDDSEGARIRWIKIVGTHYLLTSCAPCPPGTTSTNGICQKCPVNTYAAGEASTSCKPCENSSLYSVPGADKCRPKRMCTVKDFLVNYGPCILRENIDSEEKEVALKAKGANLRKNKERWERKKTFSWIEPSQCDPDLNGSKKLPPEKWVSCVPCNPGTYRLSPKEAQHSFHSASESNSRRNNFVYVNSEGETMFSENEEATSLCHPCPSGTYRGDEEDDAYDFDEDDEEEGQKEGREEIDDGAESCKVCPAGHKTPRTMYIKHLDTLDKNSFNTSCSSDIGEPSDCATAGWVPVPKGGVISGHYHKGPVQVRLELKTQLSNQYSRGIVEFAFSAVLKENSYFKVYSESNLPFVMNASTLKDREDKAIRMYLNEDDKKVVFVFVKGAATKQKKEDEDGHIGLTDEQWNPSDEFVWIKYITLHGIENATGGATSCEKCPAGYYAAQGAEECEPCEPGTAADTTQIGATCPKCPKGTYTSRYAQEKCLPCGDFTDSYPEDKPTECRPRKCGFDTVFSKEAEEEMKKKEKLPAVKFDFRDLGGNDTVIGPIKALDPDEGDFYINFCSKEGLKNVCSVKKEGEEGHDQIPPSLICQVNKKKKMSFGWGSMVGFKFNQPVSSSIIPIKSFSLKKFLKSKLFKPSATSLPESSVDVSFYDGQLCFEQRGNDLSNEQMHFDLPSSYKINYDFRSASSISSIRNRVARSHSLIPKPSLSSSSLSNHTSNAAAQFVPSRAILRMLCVPGLVEGVPEQVRSFSTLPVVMMSNDGSVEYSETDSNSPQHPAAIPLGAKRCTRLFEWKTDYGCRMCQEEDYEIVHTECVDKKQFVTKQLKEGVKCSTLREGSVLGHPRHEVECEMPVVKLSFWQAMSVAFSVLVVVLGIIVLVIVLCKRNKKLRYQLLQSEHSKLPFGSTSMMEDFQSHDTAYRIEEDEQSQDENTNLFEDNVQKDEKKEQPSLME
ncbi:uncharacterized protein MONOS_6527 [Monocercomonoides exilis]|uniref:uncharacterized protein n=1 Tax=Monocercomonoides exilis TaxID=2049356 RepID=UPI00355A4E74|nr:hypothetical protein MONOS_6527 [Monocercomonoides exilis]|eukprot:MONOS_6527.1-p1 / transcript=MONOS_6527.1 / gene=MONOS_6527 / organism=Monocercomonoides_exilis_PA203 / gene_product=UPF0577 protein KIAA1324-like protein / transcript_product=UPF0577 protein KIAA1324-like protein / location=Mono_scaffold00207:7197-11076(+) / protein_length=1250 / sequence_SO=supercontig / SO=protein_coding / is_pseudo=false